MRTLNTQAWLSLVVLAVVMVLLIFITAGTIQYWQAGVYLSIFIGSSLFTTIYLMKKDPALLKRRMRGGPPAGKRGTQKFIMLFTLIGFIALLVVPGLSAAFGGLQYRC